MSNYWRKKYLKESSRGSYESLLKLRLKDNEHILETPLLDFRISVYLTSALECFSHNDKRMADRLLESAVSNFDYLVQQDVFRASKYSMTSYPMDYVMAGLYVRWAKALLGEVPDDHFLLEATRLLPDAQKSRGSGKSGRMDWEFAQFQLLAVALELEEHGLWANLASQAGSRRTYRWLDKEVGLLSSINLEKLDSIWLEKWQEIMDFWRKPSNLEHPDLDNPRETRVRSLWALSILLHLSEIKERYSGDDIEPNWDRVIGAIVHN